MAIPLEGAFTNLYQSFVTGFPALIYALIALAVGYIIGRVVSAVVEKILLRMKVDQYVQEQGKLTIKLSSMFAVIIKWVIYFIAIQQAAEILGVAVISNIVSQVVLFIPGVVGAAVVLIVCYAVAQYIKEKIIGSKELYASIVGKVVFFLILYIGIATALELVGIPTSLINQVLLVIVASVGVGVSIALGWGLKDIVAEMAKEYKGQFRKRKR